MRYLAAWLDFFIFSFVRVNMLLLDELFYVLFQFLSCVLGKWGDLI